LTDARAAAVYLQDEQSRELRLAAVCGGLGDGGVSKWQPIVARVMAEGQIVTIDDLIAFPLRRRRRLEGVLVVAGLPSEKSETEASDLLNFVAAHLAIGVDHSRLAQKYAHKIVRLQRLEEENAQLLRNYDQKIRGLQKLQEISALLNSTLNQAEVRKRAIEAATALMGAETGSLLLLDEGYGELYFDVALGEKGEGVRKIRLKVGQGIAGYVAQTGEPVVINDVQNDPRFAREADEKTGFVTRNMVCVPVKAHGKLLGVLQAINKLDGGLFNATDREDFVSLANQVGIAIENANLYEEISRLLEGFISASVVAIESRDPATSGHSQRVATLTCGLAQTVERVERGPYAGLIFTPDQMKEMRYAAVLHDFGKVGVREHVLVKANKLLPGDLALLKARFDFIKRTLEVRALRRKVEILMSGDRASTVAVLAEVDKDLARRIAETEGLLEFLLVSNRPTVLEKGGFERLNEIARMTYHSYEGIKPYLTAEEVLTLSIPRGSLTDAERREIERHVTHTYRFLSTIPWTKALKNIPTIAYGHHEKLDGTGYPRQVASEAISVQTRMMTITDIYDALTASDRPYKKAVPTPVALDILNAEQKAGKLDRDLLDVFIDAKVYLRVHGTDG
jgi:HD-GYP domain-containing protein (c-di-GMP phosphodiesterase class II)